MNKDSLQEKFQITSPPKKTSEDTGANWVWPFNGNSEVRSVGDAGFLHRNNDKSADVIGVKFNHMPPGMDIGNQRRALIPHSPFVMAGETDVSGDTNPGAMEYGFTRREMKSTDDQYTGEHMDHFYGIAHGTDDTGQPTEGFVERNNYLDRE